MNKHRIGRPYTRARLEGFTRALHRLIPEMPTGDYSGLRKRILNQPVDPYKDLKDTTEPVSIAVDSTGISVHKAGGWIERKHGKKRRYIKLHFAVNIESKEVVAMEVTTDDVHDVKALPGLVEEAGRNVRGLGYERWAKLSGYGRRWAVETAYSSFKRLFSEHSKARGVESIVRELAGKVCLYNLLVNM